MPSSSALRVALLAGVAGAWLTGCTPSPGSTPAASAPAASTPAASTSEAPTAAAPPSSAPPSPTSTTHLPTTPAPTPVVERGDGVLTVVPGTGPVSGPGQPTPYVVEVEGRLGVDAQAFARDVDRILTDPRSWGAGGRRALHRVPGGEVGLRVALVSPDTADRLCAPLQTNGYFSCGTDDRAVLNVARWLTGAQAYGGDLRSYRHYVVNHEVGHVLGRGHEVCPGAGQSAPVMMQQTKGLDGCAVNSWPYP